MTVEAPALPGHRDAPAEPDLLPVEPGYVQVIRARTALAWLPVVAGALVLDWTLLDGSRWNGALSVAIPLLAIASLAVAPRRIWRRLGYRLEPDLLQVVRGWLFHVDTMVPFVRVQHIDVTRGPFDKMFGTASLVVHTAGTHNSIVILPGLSPQRAGELGQIIRSHIKADLD